MGNDTWFYDRYGFPKILLLVREVRFVDKLGNPLGYIIEDKLYNYNGLHCGWIENGVIRDKQGYVAGFRYNANDSPSPILPIPQIPPIPRIPRIPPIPRIPRVANIKPIKKFNWSPINLENIFE